MSRIGGTIKAQVIKPLGDVDWPEFGSRLHTLRGTLGEALTLTMRKLYPHAIDSLDAMRNKTADKNNMRWIDAVEPTLRETWNSVLPRKFEFDRLRHAKQVEQYEKELAVFEKKQAAYTKKRDRGVDAGDAPKRPKAYPAFFESAYEPVQEAHTAETISNLKVRFVGEPLKDLLANRASIPSWKTGCAFFLRSRVVSIEGKPESASIEVPLWPGRKVEIAIAPEGNGHKALWRRLVRGERSHHVLHDVEKKARKEAYDYCEEKGIPKAEQKTWTEAKYEAHLSIESATARLTTKPDAKSPPERRQADLVNARNAFEVEWAAPQQKYFEAKCALDAHPGMKLGKVGFTYDTDKRKWYALITWTAPLEPPKDEGIKATCNLGVHVFLRGISEEGDTYRIPGHQMVAIRRQFQGRRKETAKSLKVQARGSSGHGYQRKMTPLTKLDRREADYIKTFIEQQAAAFVDWCVEKNITYVYFEDYKGARKEFEKKTGGEANEEVKRFVHNFPHYQWRQAIERAAQRGGRKTVILADGRRVKTNERFPIVVEFKEFRYQSQKCPMPECGHTSPENHYFVAGAEEHKSEWNGAQYETWRHTNKETLFACQKCGRRGDGDLIAALNNLVSVGCKNPAKNVLYLAEKKGGGAELATEIVAKEQLSP